MNKGKLKLLIISTIIMVMTILGIMAFSNKLGVYGYSIRSTRFAGGR